LREGPGQQVGDVIPRQDHGEKMMGDISMKDTTKKRWKRRPYGSMRRAARELGVTRQHLHFVLKGERASPRIQKWLKRHGKEITA
jgi:hypothetical protein